MNYCYYLYCEHYKQTLIILIFIIYFTTYINIYNIQIKFNLIKLKLNKVYLYSVIKLISSSSNFKSLDEHIR